MLALSSSQTARLTDSQPRHVLDIHLSHHIDVLLSQIRSRAIVQYFAPFSTTSLGRMATAFGWTETLMQAEVVRLIGTKDLKARVDSRNKVRCAMRSE